MPNTLTIQQTYHDALNYASASINKKNKFYITPSEHKVLIKLIHYSKTYNDITFQNIHIAKHLFLAESTVKDSLESLNRKNFIRTELDIFNNRLGYKSRRTIYINWLTISDVKNQMEQFQLNDKENVPEIQPHAYIEQVIKEEPKTNLSDFDAEEEYADLLDFVNEYQKTYTGAKGRHWVIQNLLRNKQIKTKKQIIELFEKD
ncbi:MAG: hypothetical protein M0D53_14110 [Flavobacterium sp. JAD_PAG50586_2]|nr:MAG: hypothetical protein M0D53_14110 [Flavobacterium sp. JAD_PAG50586_2]